MFCFKIRNCRVKIHFTIFVLLAFCTLFTGIENGAFLVFSIILHEMAHLCMMFHLKKEPAQVMVSGLGMRIQLPYGGGLSYKDNMKISLAGPLVNVLLGAVMLVVFNKNDLAAMNLALGFMHLLPIEPLDGGLAMRAFLSERFGAEKARKFTVAVSLVLLFPIMVLGFMVLLQTKNNFSLLALSVYLMLYLVLKKDMFMS